MHEPRIIGINHILVWMLLAPVFSSLAHSSSSTADARPQICAVPRLNKSPLELPICYLDGDDDERNSQSEIAAESSGTTTSTATTPPPAQTAATEDSELDSESPLDTANFLSFEDWKKQNLAKIGQSADTVGSRQRQGGGGGDGERRTQARAMNNALDALGDDAEIDLDFGGFGAESNNNAESESWGRKVEDSSSGTTNGETDSMQNIADDSADGVSAMGRRKDAGTTCKERFNYASFDCAATVLKTNPECSGSSSVLIENKDSYMLNECRAKNKFVILELCDDILVDTIVLANYEFFSSIFHTFRVSVSDRYPVKSDKWKDLGVFEAKNTRAVQAFAVANPLIWARYVRIEFLTHYGNEFYCPLSLVRIHGTTMLEEYKNEGENRVEEDMEEVSEPVDPTETEAAVSPVVSAHPENITVSTTPKAPDLSSNETSPARNSLEEAVFGYFLTATCAATEYASTTTSAVSTPSQSSSPAATSTTSVKATDNTTTTAPSSSSEPVIPSEHVTGQPEYTNSSHIVVPSSTTQQQQNSTQPESSASNSTSTSTSASTSTTSAKESSSASAETTKVTPANPPSPNPTTQESFFKSVNKRLQMLESNSSLSLLYIEEQSQILRDAFSKVEKRQLTKLNTFLESLNATVIDEIRNLQNVYQSLRTIILDDFETQQREVSSTASQLAVLTDELVFQKRMTAISSVLIILLFALILIPRGGSGAGGAVGSMIDFQSMMAWSPRQPSSPKTPKVPSSDGGGSSSSAEVTTPSTEPEEDPTTRRRSHVDYAATNGLPTGLSTESVPITYAEKQARTTRSLSQLSETHQDSGVYSPPFSSNDSGVEPAAAATYETTPTLRTGLIPRLMMKQSPVMQHERPVSSPPVLTRTVASADAADAAGGVIAGAATELVVVSDTESDISTEPFPPFSQ